MQTQFTIIGSNGSMPNCFMVTLAAGQLADAQLNIVRHRNTGESDVDFWGRVTSDVGSLLTPIDRAPTMGVVVVLCLYGDRDFNDPIPFPSGVFKS